MLVTMTHQISGTIDGVEWPAPGGTIDVSDDEAATLIANGLAEPAGEPAPDPAPVEESRKGARKATNEPG
jgi:hypothetical protein